MCVIRCADVHFFRKIQQIMLLIGFQLISIIVEQKTCSHDDPKMLLAFVDVSNIDGSCRYNGFRAQTMLHGRVRTAAQRLNGVEDDGAGWSPALCAQLDRIGILFHSLDVFIDAFRFIDLLFSSLKIWSIKLNKLSIDWLACHHFTASCIPSQIYYGGHHFSKIFRRLTPFTFMHTLDRISFSFSYLLNVSAQNA